MTGIPGAAILIVLAYLIGALPFGLLVGRLAGGVDLREHGSGRIGATNALRTRKALKGLASGDLLVVECTDPLSNLDIPNLVRETGDALENTASADEVITFSIRKK